MKKLLILVAVTMMAVTSVNAQVGYEDTKHEVAVGVGGISNSQWIDVLENVMTVFVGATYKDEKFVGPFTMEYFYHTKKWLGVGGVFVFGQSKQDMYLAGSKAGKRTDSYYTLMPAVKFDWLRKKNFGLYSKVAFGATLRRESITDDEDSSKNSSDTGLHVNWQLSGLGVEVGSPYVRGFFEVGSGEQGVMVLGLRCKF